VLEVCYQQINGESRSIVRGVDGRKNLAKKIEENGHEKAEKRESSEEGERERLPSWREPKSQGEERETHEKGEEAGKIWGRAERGKRREEKDRTKNRSGTMRGANERGGGFCPRGTKSISPTNETSYVIRVFLEKDIIACLHACRSIVHVQRIGNEMRDKQKQKGRTRARAS